MQNFDFIFSRKIAKTKRNGLRFASRCEITKKKKKRNGRTLAAPLGRKQMVDPLY